MSCNLKPGSMKRTDKNGKEEKSLHVRVKQVSVQNRNKVSIDIRLLLSFWGNVIRKWPNIKFTNQGIMVPTKTIKTDFPTGNHTWNVPKPSQKNVFFSISIYVLWFKDIYKSFADLGMAQNILHALFFSDWPKFHAKIKTEYSSGSSGLVGRAE